MSEHSRVLFASLALLPTAAFAVPAAANGETVIFTQEALLSDPSGFAGSHFGAAVARDGVLVAASAPSWGSYQQGRVLLFTVASGPWQLLQTIPAPQPGQAFGRDLDLEGDHLLALSLTTGTRDPLALHSYVRGSSGTFAYEALVPLPSNPPGSTVGGVAIHGERAVASHGANHWTDRHGWARVFRRGSSGWLLEADLAMGGAANTTQFGSDCAIDRDTIVISEPWFSGGGVHVFTRDGSQWPHRTVIAAPAGAGNFGVSVALEDDVLVVGAQGPLDQYPERVYVYRGAGADWSLAAELAASDETTSRRQFGHDVALDEGWILVGAPWHGADTGNPRGAAYLFLPDGASWSESAKFSALTPATDGEFGSAVALDRGLQRTTIGAPGLDGVGGVAIHRFREAVSSYCSGDGSGALCPCGNTGASTSGCANSVGPGAELSSNGSTEVSDDDLVLFAIGLVPFQPALLFAGTHTTGEGSGLPFGDGLRCAGGAVARLGVTSADGSGAASWGGGLGIVGGWTEGDTRAFQSWYRDPLGPCGSGFNASQGLRATFVP